jgi:DNA-binding transcriptional MerR regulator
MPIENDREVYYWTLEVCRNARISRSTLLRWLRQGIIEEPLRDRRGYRIFNEADVKKIKAEVGKKYRFPHATQSGGQT